MKQNIAIMAPGSQNEIIRIEVENEQIKNVTYEDLNVSTTNYLSLWLYYKNITELYVEDVSEELKQNLNQIGVIVRHKSTLTNKFFFKSTSLS